MAILVSLPGPVRAAETEQTLSGYFMSGFQDRQKPLEATFKGVGEGRWQVVFRFEFNGRKHAYRGSARGSLQVGGLRGTVRNEGGQRTFTFVGSFEDGEFRGTHAEVSRGRETKTGTLSLKH